MALQGCLKIGGNTYGVVECEYSFNQTTDNTGKASSRPEGGIIKFVMPATSDDDLFFYRWMFNKAEVNAGVFRFCVYSKNNKRSYKTVAFANAFCVGLRDYFNDNDSKLMYTTVTLSAEVIRVGKVQGALFSNDWSQNAIQMLKGQIDSMVNSFPETLR